MHAVDITGRHDCSAAVESNDVVTMTRQWTDALTATAAAAAMALLLQAMAALGARVKHICACMHTISPNDRRCMHASEVHYAGANNMTCSRKCARTSASSHCSPSGRSHCMMARTKPSKAASASCGSACVPLALVL